MGGNVGPRGGAGPSFGGFAEVKNRVSSRGWREASTVHHATSPNDSFGAVEDDDDEEQPLRNCHRDTCPSLLNPTVNVRRKRKRNKVERDCGDGRRRSRVKSLEREGGREIR
ncbi:hypothetical protein B296_00020035 [Ensete ventricosum]|uniref:Uncharacterized protein n=1 Tax=Ensete ventricosum TaxID=4639 RepID=A0A427A8R2_ENSVE|nr:hypothetical protein B296_00020035 [Ensete ventricosum]